MVLMVASHIIASDLLAPEQAIQNFPRVEISSAVF
jgi:hypothetical protein